MAGRVNGDYDRQTYGTDRQTDRQTDRTRLFTKLHTGRIIDTVQ